MKNSLMSLKIILFNSFSWFIPNCCMCELPPNNWPKNRSKNWIKNHPKNPPKDRIKNRSKIRPKNCSNNCPKDRRVLQGPVGPHNLGAQQLRWSLKAEENQNVQLFRVLEALLTKQKGSALKNTILNLFDFNRMYFALLRT